MKYLLSVLCALLFSSISLALHAMPAKHSPLTMTSEFDYNGLIIEPNGSGYFGYQSFSNTSEVTLYPKNGNTATWTLTLRYSNGKPATGVNVNITAQPSWLTAPSWRHKNAMAARFPRSSQSKVKLRIDQGIFRLKAPFSPSSAVTDSQGQVKVTINNFHSCGNSNQPGADLLTANAAGQQLKVTVKCAVSGLVNIPDRASQGLTTAGLVGRHINPAVLTAMQNLGTAWKNVSSKPAGMPNYLTITGATMRWGGINPPHFTHKFGGTLDIRPIGTKSGPVSVGDAHYHRGATQAIVNALVQMGATKIIFADNLKGVTDVKANHKNHLHVSFLTEPLEPWLSTDETVLDDEGLPLIDYSNSYEVSHFIPQVKTLQTTDFNLNFVAPK
ncbi:hypothetical protein PSECIP111854_03316 [Pseudoalteromonas sp. CIP111854]|uniref:Uncharacterized protein n=1 Tax=Pseudoalteromonas holothuriae TaxID=2963714 RepID=A0A9W4R2E4_9GAMM|nr:hypothetical protein [Pseudoalteromonas sp. CIP111854]CAH9063899.1 hypothetical protein PSECIP111854_03316 [Pseudoalteromonas sp. CIP111854]